MKRFDCQNQSTDVKLPPCAGALADVEAVLMRDSCTPVPLTLTDHGSYITVAIQNPLPPSVPFPRRGVWTLSVKTKCGCYEAAVYVDCPGPQFLPVHDASLPIGPSIECCLPDNAITFEVRKLDGDPEVYVEGYPDAVLSFSEQNGYQLVLGVTAPSLHYQWIDTSGNLYASGTFAAQGATQFHQIDLMCATYALVPVEDEE